MSTIAPTPQLFIDARHVVSHPELFHNSPTLRLHAWASLMNERGNQVRQDRLAHMQRERRSFAQLLISKIVMEAPSSHPDYATPPPPDGGRAA